MHIQGVFAVAHGPPSAAVCGRRRMRADTTPFPPCIGWLRPRLRLNTCLIPHRYVRFSRFEVTVIFAVTCS